MVNANCLIGTQRILELFLQNFISTNDLIRKHCKSLTICLASKGFLFLFCFRWRKHSLRAIFIYFRKSIFEALKTSFCDFLAFLNHSICKKWESWKSTLIGKFEEQFNPCENKTLTLCFLYSEIFLFFSKTFSVLPH